MEGTGSSGGGGNSAEKEASVMSLIDNMLERMREPMNIENANAETVRGVRARSARISIISHFHVSIMSLKLQEYRSLIPQENHSKINAQMHTRL